jgi:NitT/TauT family transport system ATP-binding protein
MSPTADRVLVLSRRPTRVIEDITVPLGKPRDQIETREHRVYLEIRHTVLAHIRAMKHANPDRTRSSP